MELPNYDNWKTHNPDDDRCEFCGAAPYEFKGGWQPERCNGECRQSFRDPDAEYDRIRDERPMRPKHWRGMPIQKPPISWRRSGDSATT